MTKWPPTYRLKVTHSKVARDTGNEQGLKMAWKTNYNVVKSVIIASADNNTGWGAQLYLPSLS